MFKPRRLVGGWIKVEGGDEGGRYCPKYLKRGGTEKRGMGHKNLKTGGGKLDKGVDAFKRGSGTPLRTMFKAFS